jgi:hypothetical protein
MFAMFVAVVDSVGSHFRMRSTISVVIVAGACGIAATNPGVRDRLSDERVGA